MIELSNIKDKMRVKIISVPNDSPDYYPLINKFGTIEGFPYDGEEGEKWIFVLVDGERSSDEFKLSELESAENIQKTYTKQEIENIFNKAREIMNIPDNEWTEETKDGADFIIQYTLDNLE